jgi:hypothetical protein
MEQPSVGEFRHAHAGVLDEAIPVVDVRKLAGLVDEAGYIFPYSILMSPKRT